MTAPTVPEGWTRWRDRATGEVVDFLCEVHPHGGLPEAKLAYYIATTPHGTLEARVRPLDTWHNDMEFLAYSKDVSMPEAEAMAQARSDELPGSHLL